MKEALTDGQKLDLVIVAGGISAPICEAITVKLITELISKPLSAFDDTLIETISKASNEIKMIFVLGGLRLMLESQKAISSGWKPSKEMLEKVKGKIPTAAYEQMLKDFDMPDKPDTDDNIPQFFRG